MTSLEWLAKEQDAVVGSKFKSLRRKNSDAKQEVKSWEGITYAYSSYVGLICYSILFLESVQGSSKRILNDNHFRILVRAFEVTVPLPSSDVSGSNKGGLEVFGKNGEKFKWDKKDQGKLVGASLTNKPLIHMKQVSKWNARMGSLLFSFMTPSQSF